MVRSPIWFTLAIAVTSTARADPGADESKRDEAALRALEDHWSRAESDGDVAYLSQLFAPEFRSISPTGETATRAAILEHAAKRNTEAARAQARKNAKEYLAKHPTQMAVTVEGAVGIVSFYNPQRGADHAVRGADILVYEDNRWHAVYSIHNGAE